MKKELTSKVMHTKARIIHVAKELFIKKEYTATTLRKIARSASVTTGAFYKYYRSKDEILVSIFNEGFIKQWRNFYDLKDDFEPKDYIEMDAKLNKGLADAFGHELFK